MAEKEEKTKDIIYVFSQQLICKDCKDWYEHIDPLDKPDCDNCEDIADLPHISYQEAIRKICDAYFKAKDKGLMESERVVAALNSLLEADR